MKKRNPTAVDEAILINAAGDRPIDHLDGGTLQRHLEAIFVFKLGLRNSFGVDLRENTFTPADDGRRQGVLFNYLSELTPLLSTRVQQLTARQQRAYAELESQALDSFWEIYYRFQPLLHKYADRFEVDIDALGNVLGRAILLFDKERRVKFFSYLDKTLRESVKNLRGQALADQYCLPLSAGRLLPQIFWMLDQETLRLSRRLTPDESDAVVIHFLSNHRAQFSQGTMRTIAAVARTQRATTSIYHEAIEKDLSETIAPGACARSESSSGVDEQDEFEFMLSKIRGAIERAGFDETECAIVLERLDLAYDKLCFDQIAASLSAGSLRNRRARLLVRFLAAMFSTDSPRFGRFLRADPQASRAILSRSILETATHFNLSFETFVQRLLNTMSLSESVYRLSIAERGRLEKFLHADPTEAERSKVDGHLFNKLKAALMDQDRQRFPCLRST